MRVAVALLLAGFALAQATDVQVDWQRPSNGRDYFDPAITIALSDTVTFEMDETHDLYLVGKLAYDSCIAQTTQGKLADGQSFTFKPTSTGQFYFVSQADGDCKAGMKLNVEVVAQLPPAPAPAPTTILAPEPAMAPAPIPAAVVVVGAPTPQPAESAEFPLVIETGTTNPAPNAPSPTTAIQSTSAGAVRTPAAGLLVAAAAMLLALLA